MKNKSLPYIVGGVLVAALVGAAIYFGGGEQFQGDLAKKFTTTRSAPSPKNYLGACVIRDLSTTLPTYYQADTSTGYTKLKKGSGFTDISSIRTACTEADYKGLSPTFCQQNPGEKYQEEVALYYQSGGYTPEGGDPVGPSHGQDVQGSPYKVCPSLTKNYLGACVIRDSSTTLPTYNQADTASGYAKLKKGSGFADIGSIRTACTEADYQKLSPTFCQQNPGEKYQEEVALYYQSGGYMPEKGDPVGPPHGQDVQGAPNKVCSSSSEN